ncbi:patatin-like phospholipase family protein [Chitinibacter sp. S2-10]|uniref:patatin-like phospholipase family protein n=1 Tax=Chitinibacter sp. S2-10 TaxID=3373597 RepID=UPI00397736D8
MISSRQFVTLALLLITGLSAASETRPRIGLVLGGGGARGFAHIGVLKVLEENHIPVDCIVGTSIGSLVGAAYASGRSTGEMTQRIKDADWDDLLSSQLPRKVNSYRKKADDALALIPVEVGLADDLQVKLPTAAISTQKIEFFLRELTYAGTAPNFDRLPIPYRAIATDLVTGDMVVFKDGDLVTAMRASMSVPGLFPAVVTKEQILVDGGLVRNVPVDVARQTCADVVIAIDVGSAPLKRDELSSLLSVADQYTRLMMVQNVKPQLESLSERDVLITPQLGALSSSDFKKSTELIALGEQAALAALPQLKRYAIAPASFEQWNLARQQNHLQSRPIGQVVVKDPKLVNPAVLEKALEVQTGDVLDVDRFHGNLAEIYARGDFSQLDYELLRQGENDTLTVLPIEKSWGPNYLNFGIGFGTDGQGATPWNISMMYRRTWVNDLGAEWKTILKLGSSQIVQTEFYQPLQLNGLLFVAPYLYFKETPLALWFAGNQISNYAYQRSAAGVDIGSTVTKYGELRFGPVANRYEMQEDIGPQIFTRGSTQDLGLRASLLYDQLDNYFFPRHGDYVSLNAYASLKSDGDFDDYGRFGIDMKTARPVGDGTLMLSLRGQETLGSAPPYVDTRWLGGFLNLSGYRYQELLTNRFVYGAAQYYQAMPWLARSYWGVALETARTFDRLNTSEHKDWRFSTAAYLAYDSYLGPLYLGAAYGDNSLLTYYFMLGKQF